MSEQIYDAESEEFDPIEVNELDEEYARRIEQEVLHIQQEQAEGAEGAEGAEEDERDEQAESVVRRPNILFLLFSGNILLLRGLAKYYGHMALIALLFLISIVVMFWSLHLDMEHNAKVSDLQLLRERSVRLQQERYTKASHSAIVEECEQRNLKIVDPSTPATVIKQRGLWRELLDR